MKYVALFGGILVVVVGSYFAGSYMASSGASAHESSPDPEVVFIEEASEEVEPIVLVNDGLGSISWTAYDDASEGVQVVWSRSEEPVYPPREGDKSLFVAGDKTSASIDAFDGDGTYYVRVCVLLGDECKSYSKQIQSTFDDAGTEPRDGTSVNPLDQPKISLFGAGGASVKWTINGIAENGVKIVWSKSASPTHPTRSGDKSTYVNKQTSSSGSVYAFDGSGTYYVRVCEYTGSGCRAYSNQITLELEGEEKETKKEEEVKKEEKEVEKEKDTDVTASSISASASGSTVSWSVVGKASMGFKVVYSTVSGPTYPPRGSDMAVYVGSPDARSASVSAFKGDGTYYARVCAYTGSGCVAYSNEVTLELVK